MIKKTDMIDQFLTELKIRQIKWTIVVFFLIFIFISGILYWQDEITLGGLTFFVLSLAFIGFLYILGIRVAQKDGFIDGFQDGRDGIIKKVKK